MHPYEAGEHFLDLELQVTRHATLGIIAVSWLRCLRQIGRVSWKGLLGPRQLLHCQSFCPGLPRPLPVRPFSATTQRPSKLGRTPIAIPPGVEVTIGEPVIKKDATTYRQIAKRTVTVTGPLGKSIGSSDQETVQYDGLTSRAGTQEMSIPPYVTINQDSVTNTATLSIEDKEIKQQREMWGAKRESHLFPRTVH